jgi:hypothetical protein
MTKQLPASALQGGHDYPRYAELCAWFPDDDACLDYLDWLRWPDGFVCPRCETTKRLYKNASKWVPFWLPARQDHGFFGYFDYFGYTVPMTLFEAPRRLP